MKRMLCLLMLIFSVFGFSSCSSGINMEKLTDYQNKDFSAFASVAIDGVKYKINVKKQADSLYISFTEPKALSSYEFIVNENTLSVRSGTFIVPIDAGAQFKKISALAGLFRVSCADTWRIKKESVGGVPVYLCKNESDGTVLYIDASSHLPLKIICGGVEADITSFHQ